MKRALLFIFMTVCVLGMSACSSKDAMPETSDSASNPVQNTDISNLNGGKIWFLKRRLLRAEMSLRLQDIEMC